MVTSRGGYIFINTIVPEKKRHTTDGPQLFIVFVTTIAADYFGHDWGTRKLLLHIILRDNMDVGGMWYLTQC